MTYYPVFQNTLKLLAELNFWFTPNVDRKAIFRNVPIISFKSDKSLKDHLGWVVLPKVDTEDRSKPCNGEKRSCEVCKSVNDTSDFKRRDAECKIQTGRLIY